MAKKEKNIEWTTVPIRMTGAMLREVKDTGVPRGLTDQATIRLAIEKGLPILLKALGKGAK